MTSMTWYPMVVIDTKTGNIRGATVFSEPSPTVTSHVRYLPLVDQPFSTYDQAVTFIADNPWTRWLHTMDRPLVLARESTWVRSGGSA